MWGILPSVFIAHIQLLCTSDLTTTDYVRPVHTMPHFARDCQSQHVGDKKHFECGNTSISQQKNKQLLSTDEKESSEIKMKIFKIMLKDNSNLETSLVYQVINL